MIEGFQIRAEWYYYLCWCLSQKDGAVKVLWTEICQILPVIILFSYSRTAYLTHFKHMELLRNKNEEKKTKLGHHSLFIT